ncbi:MAG: glycosyltransferase family 39 protein [Acidobacteriaceae bacterium]|nr:glycosyltransferase family 39 protein [Acidobacteriaceae bacterium]
MQNTSSSWRLPWFLIVYSVFILSILPFQSLWLDEILQLLATRSNWTTLINGYATHSAGQSPLVPIEQFLTMKLLGYSVWSARLPAAIASIAAYLGMVKLAERAGLNNTYWPLIVFATLPLQLRYATEARPYGQVLCLAIWLTVKGMDILGSPRLHLRDLLIYLVLLLAGLYTQPFVVFVAVSHAFYSVVRRRARLWPFLFCLFIAAAAYAPWYFQSHRYWQTEIAASELHFHWQAKLPLVVFRELLGTGYVGTALLLVSIILAVKGRRKLRPDTIFWACGAIVPVCLVIAADACFDYFYAIRQMIFVLPAFVILATPVFEDLQLPRWKILTAALILLNLGYDVRWFTKPRENWKAAADLMWDRAKTGACVIALPAESLDYYSFFRPELSSRICDASTLSRSAGVELAISPYLRDREQQRNTLSRPLVVQGFQLRNPALYENPRVLEFVRK